MALSRAKTFARPKKTPELQAIYCPLPTLSTSILVHQSCTFSGETNNYQKKSKCAYCSRQQDSSSYDLIPDCLIFYCQARASMRMHMHSFLRDTTTRDFEHYCSRQQDSSSYDLIPDCLIFYCQARASMRMRMHSFLRDTTTRDFEHQI